MRKALNTVQIPALQARRKNMLRAPILQANVNEEARLQATLRPLGVAVAAALSPMWEGLPFAFAGLPRAGGFYATTGFIAIGAMLFFLRVSNGRSRFNIFNVTSIFLFATCIVSTILSSLMFFQNPLSEWLPTIVYYSPILLILALDGYGIRLGELIVGIVVASVGCAVLVFVDHFSQLEPIQAYLSVSGFDITNRRIMLLKNETAFGIVILFSLLASTKNILIFISLIPPFVLLCFDLIVVTEVRLVIGATLLAIASIVIFMLPLMRKLTVATAGIVFMIFAAPFIFEKYIDRITGVSDIATQDAGVAWRLTTVQHYYNYFCESWGLGFGIMSISPNANNILSYSVNKAQFIYGITDFSWGLFLADISLFSALFQFGVVGLVIVVFMSIFGSAVMIRAGLKKNIPYHFAIGALGFLMLFLIVNPWPLNFFTLSWSMMGGNILWTIASRVYALRAISGDA